MLNTESLSRIDREINKYPPDQKQSAVMAALAIAQEELGWLPSEAIEFVANYLGMPPMAAYEVASFYNMYDLKPVGKYKLTVCTNLPCQLQGATVCAAHAKKKLGIDFGETTADGRFTLNEGDCMGACGDGPVSLINNVKMCAKLTPEEADRILAGLE